MAWGIDRGDPDAWNHDLNDEKNYNVCTVSTEKLPLSTQSEPCSR